MKNEMQNKFICKIHGSLDCYRSDFEKEPIFSVSGFGKLIGFIRKLNSRVVGPDAEIFRFLMGERIYSETGRMTCSFAGRFLRRVGILESEPSKESSDKSSREVVYNQEALDRFLRNRLRKATRGECSCEVSGLGPVDLQMIPGSWQVIRFDRNLAAGPDTYRLKLSFNASILLKSPIEPFSREELERGVLNRDSEWGSQRCAFDFQLAMGLALCDEDLYVSRSGQYFSVKPQTFEDVKILAAGELFAKGFSIFDFARLASFIVDDSRLKTDLLCLNASYEFDHSNSYMGPVRAGMFGGRLHRSYKCAPEVWQNFNKVMPCGDCFEIKMPNFLREMSRFMEKLNAVKASQEEASFFDDYDIKSSQVVKCDEGGFSISVYFPRGAFQYSNREKFLEEMQKLLDRINRFCGALQEFYHMYFKPTLKPKESACDVYVRKLVEMVWDKVALDPLVYSDDEDPMISEISRIFVNGTMC